jgi:hypothetical protein
MSTRKTSATAAFLPALHSPGRDAPAWLEDAVDLAVAAGVFLMLALVFL